MTREKILELLLSVEINADINAFLPISEALSAALACGLVEQVPGAECRLRLTSAGRMVLEDWRPKRQPEGGF